MSDNLAAQQRRMSQVIADEAVAQYGKGVAEGAAAERARILALLEGLLVRVGENSAAMGVAAALSAVRSASPSAAPSVGEDTQLKVYDWGVDR